MDNVLRPIEVGGGRREAYLGAAHRLIDLLGLDAVANRKAADLPPGMQQRASLCRALIYDPPILLLDEPFGALDRDTRTTMNAELQRIWLARRKTVLMITHNIEEAIYLADGVMVMSPRPGRIVAEVVVDFSRPRLSDLIDSPAFRRLAAAIRHHLRTSGSDA